MLNKIRKVNDFIAKILLSIGTLLFIILVLVVLLQIATRLFIPISISWTEEISRFLFLHIIAFERKKIGICRFVIYDIS